MANTTDKTVTSKYQPRSTNVIWVDTSQNPPVEKHFINGRWKPMGGGVSDYSDIKNKPTINGVELDGNKTSSDLGVYSKPSTGIPQSDLSSDVQSQLNKHFKGWFDSSSDLSTAYPTPIVGDFAYVHDASPATTVSIYRCATTGTWADSGDDVDTSLVQTFASSQEVNEVHIVNDLTTGGTEDVLSAEQGKEINEQINGTNEIVNGEELVGEGKLIQNNSNTWLEIGIDTSNNTLNRKVGVGRGVVLDLSNHRYKITLTGIDSTNQGIIGFFIKNPKYLQADTYTLQQLIANGYVNQDSTSLYKWLGKGVPREFSIPEDANYLYVATIRTNNNNCFPVSANFIDLVHIDGIKDIVDKHTEYIESIEENVSNNTEDISEIKQVTQLISEKQIVELKSSDFTDSDLYINSSHKWQKSSMPSSSKNKNVRKGEQYTIFGNEVDSYQSEIALVPFIGKEEEEVSFLKINDIQGLVFLGENESVTFKVEQDCILYVNNDINLLINVFPTEIERTSIKITENIGVTRANVNLCDESDITKGTIYNNGEVISGDNTITDFININLGSNRSYQKTQFIHVCSIDQNGSFGYNSINIAVYDYEKAFVGFVDDVSSFVDKEDIEVGNDTLFASAEYIRVEFPSTNYSYYVCNANDRNLPEYSKYNQEDLYQTREFVADKIHNSDGALTNMLQAALSYVGRGAITDLGYGDSNTAFDQYVNAVECDSWNPNRYVGEKKQINCSAFVQLALQGISFENSRYNLGSSRQNIITNYVFDNKATYNYHNAAADIDYSGDVNHVIYCSDYGKLYANTLAKYAEDRGFLFKIKDDLSNIEVGDVIFAKVGSSSTYRGIGHTLFAANVRANKDGSKSVDIMQVTGNSVENLASMSTITSRTESYIWAARFPMPVSDVIKDNLVGSFTTDTLEDVSTSETLLSTLTLTNPLKKANIYTVIGKLSSNPLGKIQPIVKVSGTAFDGNTTTLLQRPNGWFVKHIIIRYNESISNLSDVKVYVKGEEEIEGINLQLSDIRLYEGYISL